MQNLKKILNTVALDFWKERGAKIGQQQTFADLKLTREQETTLHRLYYKWDDNLKKFVRSQQAFITHMAVMESTDNDYAIRCTLWVKPILKNKAIGLPIRLTYEWIVSDNPTYVKNDPANDKITTKGPVNNKPLFR